MAVSAHSEPSCQRLLLSNAMSECAALDAALPNERRLLDEAAPLMHELQQRCANSIVYRVLYWMKCYCSHAMRCRADAKSDLCTTILSDCHTLHESLARMRVALDESEAFRIQQAVAYPMQEAEGAVCGDTTIGSEPKPPV